MADIPPKPAEQADEPATPKSGEVLPFPQTDEEHNRRIMNEVERLAGLSPGEWKLWAPKRAGELGIELKLLADLVEARLKANTQKERKALAEARLGEERAKRLRSERRDHQHDDEAKSKAALAAGRKAEKEAARQQKAAEKEAARQQKEAERKAKEKHKGFVNLLKLPVDRHDNELSKLATRLDEDLEALRQELKEFLGVELSATTPTEKTEPWPEPVDVATVLTEVGAKISKYVVMQLHLLTAAVLWTAHAWLYDHDVLTHSPILAATSAEPDSGKTTLVAACGRMTPRFSLNIEMTGPSLYRWVDAVKPTMGLDEADDLFVRKSDLKHIINAGWTRGAKIPRQVNIGRGIWTTVHFDPFTPKIIALLGRNLPPTIRSRCIELRLLPKQADEATEPFNQLDDAEFAILRRKFCRFATDNATALRDAKPIMPTGLNNRAAANWKMLLAIAELASGSWPERAREAAERLSRSGRRPSDGVQLLAAFKAVFTETGTTEITSEAIVVELRKDPTAIWADYNRGGPITQRQVAALLDAYDIHPIPLHPTKRQDFQRRGYTLAQFSDAFARYLPKDPIIRSSATRQANKRKQRKRAAQVK
jgi:hypothetical protein